MFKNWMCLQEKAEFVLRQADVERLNRHEGQEFESHELNRQLKQRNDTIRQLECVAQF